MDQRHALPSGTLVSAYQIQAELGRGGFGITYHAFDQHEQTDVALKEYFPAQHSVREAGATVVRSSDPTSEEEYNKGLDRFIAEGNNLALFRHRNIVQVRKLFRENNTAYLVLSFERGQSMKRWLQSLGRPPTQEELDSLLLPLLDALDIIHRNKLLHRDIAPDNIFLRSQNDPVLLDFGSARQNIGTAGGAHTIVVKAGYSPHEQYVGVARLQGPWTDIYALAAVLYEAVTQQQMPDASQRNIKDSFVPLAGRSIGQYRPAFLAAIDWALKLETRQRPQSIRQWRKKLFAQGPQIRNHQRRPVAETTRPLYAGVFSKVADWLR